MVSVGSISVVALAFVMSSVHGLKKRKFEDPERLVDPDPHPQMLGQMFANEVANVSNKTVANVSGTSGALATLLRDAAPRLYDDSEIKKMIEKEVGKELETRLKFYPGMTSLKQLLDWNPKIAGPRLGPVKDLPELSDKKRILSMHDMATGYNEMADNDYLMMFQTWEAVDIFVYFSHVKFAIPPLQWTMVAHQHKRPALATLIFEPSSETTNMVQEMLEKRSFVQDQLVNLADHYGFDGWFINVENIMSDWPKGDPERFVGELRQKLKKKLGKRAQVISYPYGPEDKMFNVSDGVFVNYNWGTDDESMAEIVKSAGSRKSDVYMGMDSFGGRRGDDEPDPEHVKVCAKNDLSIAVFAPAFTLEVEAKKKYSKQAVDFDRRYWSSIAENFGRPIPNMARSGNTWPIPWTAKKDKEETKPTSAPEVVDEKVDGATTMESVGGAVAAAGAVAATVAGAAMGVEIPAAAAVGATKVAAAAAGVAR